jgi:hypothetical protein
VVIVAITFRLFLETETETKRFEDCTQDEIKAFEKSASKRLSDTLSQYYTQHPHETEQLGYVR